MNKFYGLIALSVMALAVEQTHAAQTQPRAAELDARLILAQQSEPPKGDASAQEMDKRMQQMQEHMKQMHAQMEKLQKTTDPKERQKLMEEHMKAMREHMSMMRDLGGCHMMGGQAAGGRADASMGCGAVHAVDPKRRQEMMEGRMDMMQMMMEQMMQHQGAMDPKH